MTLTDYERERQERIARNKAILASLDIPKALNKVSERAPKSSSKPKPSAKKRRRASVDRVSVDHDSTTDTAERPPSTRRTSARLAKRVSACQFPRLMLAAIQVRFR